MKNKKKNTETRVDRRIEAAAFSRTVNQVLTGDQIDRLVLSYGEEGASGLRFLFVGAGIVVFCVFLLLSAAPRRVISLIRLSAVNHLVTGRLCFARAAGRRKIELSIIVLRRLRFLGYLFRALIIPTRRQVEM